MRRISCLSIGVLLALAGIILHFSSCNKIEIDQKSISQEVRQRFFEEYRSNDAVESGLVDYFRRQNDKLNFVGKTAKQIGYPRWNKLIKSQRSSIQQLVDGRNSQVFVYYIPFVRDSQNYVNASLVVSIDGMELHSVTCVIGNTEIKFVALLQ